MPAQVSRDVERKDTRAEAAKAMADLKAKGMQINEMAPAESERMRDKRTKVYAGIGADIGIDLWNETQAELKKVRSGI
jgi:TRAP-type transport system periplasmic protein